LSRLNICNASRVHITIYKIEEVGSMPTGRKLCPQRSDMTNELLQDDVQSRNVDRHEVDAATDVEPKPEAAQGGGSDWKS
jgi:hypothetical protein